MSWNTKITNMLSIKYPIILGAMAYLTDAKMAAAMSHAGGAGIIASGGLTADQFLQEVRTFRDLCGPGKTFGANLMLQTENRDDIAQIVCDEKVPFVTIGAGDPLPWIADFHAAGLLCIPVVPNTKLALRVQEGSADAVVIEGMEAGGHDGKWTTMANLENSVPAVEIPFLAAGGIMDGRGVAAALLMGASGVQIGTRFLLAEECPLHKNAKDALIQAKDIDSVVLGFTTSDSVRGLKNAFAEAYLAKEYAGASKEELDHMAVGTNRKAAIEGDIDHGFVSAGMSLNNLTRVQPTEEIMEEIVSETEQVLSKAASLI